MCLIALAWRVHARYPLALIANRDESYARPTAAAGPVPGAPHVHGGRDLLSGGSWLQVSRRGRLAAVTNVRTGLSRDTAPRSRGMLVSEFARGTDASSAYLAGLRAHAGEHGPFNLLAWEGGTLGFATNHPAWRSHAVAPGIHAMSNGAFDAPWPKSALATRALARWLQCDGNAGAIDEVDLSSLFAALAQTTPAPDALLPDTGIGLELERMLSPPFVQGTRYGTRCSTVVLVGETHIRFVERRFGPGGAALGESAITLRRMPAGTS